MKVSEKIANTIARFPVDYVFTCSDFDIEVSSKAAVVKALNRMAAAGKISKLSKGRFYKPRKTRFGALKPTSYQIAKDFLERNGEIIGYISGYSAFNSLGLTTQIPSTLHIGTNKYRRTVKRGMYTISFIVQPNKITRKNIELLRILDAIRFIKEIPATTPEEACLRLISIVSQLTEENKSALATLVLKYAPYVQSLCGAILEMAGADENILKKIIKSLNPVTEYNIPVSEEILPNKKKWRIR